MDPRDGFDNSQDKPSMYYSNASRIIASNKISKPLIKHGKQNMTQHFAEDKSWISKFEPSPFLDLKATIVEPSQRRQFEDSYSHPSLGNLPIKHPSYTAFDETAGNMQATCLSSLNKREPLDSMIQELNYLSISQTHSRLYGNELTGYSAGHSNELAEIPPIQSQYGNKLDKKIPNQTCYDSRLDKTLQTRLCYNSGLDRILPAQTYYDSRLERILPTPTYYDCRLERIHQTQTCYESGLDKILPTQPNYDSGLDKTHPIQNRYDSGMIKASKLESQHFNQVDSSQESRKDFYSRSLPVQHSKNEVSPPVFNPCTKLRNSGNFHETNLSRRSINEPVTGTFQGNDLFKTISSGGDRWPHLPSKLLGDGKELKFQTGSNYLKDLIHLNIFLTGPAQCGLSTLLKTFITRHVKLPNTYDFSQGFIALIAAFGKKILIKFSIIQELRDCQKELDMVKKDRICILVMVYSLDLPKTLRKIDVYVKKNKQYFINSRVPIVLVGSTGNPEISSKDTNKKFPTFEGGPDVWTLHPEVMKAFTKCSEKAGEDVEQVFSLVMKLALFQSA